jgi:hypothetical protein
MCDIYGIRNDDEYEGSRTHPKQLLTEDTTVATVACINWFIQNDYAKCDFL